MTALVIHSADRDSVTWRKGGDPNPWITSTVTSLRRTMLHVREYGHARIAGWIVDEADVIELHAAIDEAALQESYDIRLEKTHDRIRDFCLENWETP